MGSDKGSPCTENAIEVPVGGSPDDLTRCPFRKFGASRTSCPRRRASSPRGIRALDSRFRGNDAKLPALAVYL
jgi:hypothetical protein